MRSLLFALPASFVAASIASAQSGPSLDQLARVIDGEKAAIVGTFGRPYGTTIRDPHIEGDEIVGSVESGSLYGRPTYSTARIPLRQVRSLELKTGRLGLEGTLGGGLVGAVTAMTIHFICRQQEPDGCAGSNLGAAYGIAIGGGALVGGIWGLTQERWETVYTSDRPVRFGAWAAPMRGTAAGGFSLALRF